MITYHLHKDDDGWRTGLGWRTRRRKDGWTVQRWNGDGWETTLTGLDSYADARLADELWNDLFYPAPPDSYFDD